MNANRLLTENSRAVLGFALALWAASVALAGMLGSFTNLGPRLGLTIAAFAALFAVATYYLDRGVRGVVDAIETRTLVASIAAGLALIAGIVVAGVAPQSLTSGVRVLIPLFVAPVTIAMHVALLDRLLRAPSRAASGGVRRQAIVVARAVASAGDSVRSRCGARAHSA